MVQSAGPVDSSVGVSMIQLDGAPYRPSSRYLAVLEEAIEDRTVLANIDYAVGWQNNKQRYIDGVAGRTRSSSPA